ncbi:MAG: arylsulfotransferase family protein [Geminicoccaceae bacterium]
MASWLLRNWEKLAFGLALLLAIFVYGYLAGARGWFPASYIRPLEITADELIDEVRKETRTRSEYLRPTSRTQGGLVASDPSRAFDGYTFITAYRDGRFGASLLDMQGNTVHKWDVAISQAYPNGPPPHLKQLPPDQDANVHGAELLPNGEVLLNLFSTGTVKLDRCSKIEWVLPLRTHHALEPLGDGTYIAPMSRTGKEPKGEFPRVGPSEAGAYADDGMVRFDSDGKVLREASIIDILRDSGWDEIFVMGSGSENQVRIDDPVHMNKIGVLDPAMADRFPLFKAGDLVVSMRRPSTVVVLDGETWQVKWGTSGQFHMQHDPSFTPEGTILIYDNNVTIDKKMAARSRIIEIDPTSQKVVWSYDGGKDAPFYAYRRGTVRLLPNGNVLVTDPEEGRIFEVARHNGDDIVWDWVNLSSEPGFAGLVIDAKRYPPDFVNFLNQPCG